MYPGSTERHAGGGGLQPDLLSALPLSALRYAAILSVPVTFFREPLTMQHERLAKARRQ